MRVAVISDIHANLQALEAVLAAIEADGTPDQIWCLGDVVGYGADPDRCMDLVRERCDLCLVGNHDLAVTGALDVSAFSASAAEAVQWTRDHADERTVRTLRELEPSSEREGIGLFHASPRDPVWEYVLSTDQAEECMAAHPRRIGLIGHSHVALFFTHQELGGRTRTSGEAAPAGLALELAAGSWLINPGSVGQPRDGDPRASWLSLDTGSLVARFHRVSYDIRSAAEAIVRAGLPEPLAERLHAGR